VYAIIIVAVNEPIRDHSEPIAIIWFFSEVFDGVLNISDGGS